MTENQTHTIRISPTDTEIAAQFGITIESPTPRTHKLTGPDGEAQVKRGVGDGQVRIFQQKQCLGTVREEDDMQEAFDLVCHAFSQGRFHEKMAAASEGEQE